MIVSSWETIVQVCEDLLGAGTPVRHELQQGTEIVTAGMGEQGGAGVIRESRGDAPSC